MKVKLLLFLLLTSFGFMAQTSKKSKNTVYIGTYTRDEGFVKGKAKGIYYMLQDPGTGSMEMGNIVAKVVNPSYVKVSIDGKNLYAVSELVANEADSGEIFSFRINPDNSLAQLGKLPTNGFAPCHIETDKTGNFIFVANYVGGVAMVYKRGENGILKVQQQLAFENPDKSHIHSVNVAPDNKHVYINDLGNDKIWIYKMDAEKVPFQLEFQGAVKLKDGAGPRHFSFSEDGNFGYSVNELNSSISVFKIEENGDLSEIQSISTLPDDFKGKNSAAEIHTGKWGNFLYASNRGNNSIATYKIDKNTGKLSVLNFTKTGGETPRNFTISPDGKFLYAANQDSGDISGFKINKETGDLTSLFKAMEAPTPVCIEFY